MTEGTGNKDPKKYLMPGPEETLRLLLPANAAILLLHVLTKAAEGVAGSDMLPTLENLSDTLLMLLGSSIFATFTTLGISMICVLVRRRRTK